MYKLRKPKKATVRIFFLLSTVDSKVENIDFNVGIIDFNIRIADFKSWNFRLQCSPCTGTHLGVWIRGYRGYKIEAVRTQESLLLGLGF